MNENLMEMTPEMMQKLTSSAVLSCVTRLLVGNKLTEQEIDLLSDYTNNELAMVTANLVSHQLLALKDPIIIMNAAASIYGNLANIDFQDMDKNQNYANNMQAIETLRQQKNSPKR
ncbi:MAG: hypothetical protein HFI09_01650 [Bacilli bacterium]|nr:hypothetical protein [Bacilli bacterium]